MEFVRAKKPDPKKDSRDTSALSSRREANTSTPELPLYLRSAQQSLVSSPKTGTALASLFAAIALYIRRRRNRAA